MRTFKFRAWSPIYKKMNNDYMIDGGWESCQLDDFFNKDYRIVMQFTGLKDKNGKEIYEGDIVSFGKHLGNGIVKFGDYSAGGDDYYAQEAYGFYIEPLKKKDIKWTETLTNEYEVIGNKFENPELLK